MIWIVWKSLSNISFQLLGKVVESYFWKKEIKINILQLLHFGTKLTLAIAVIFSWNFFRPASRFSTICL